MIDPKRSNVEPFITDKMRSWIADYIRSHRKAGNISLDVRRSKFTNDFWRTFKLDAMSVIYALIRHGFLEGIDRPAKGHRKASFAIWLVEDKGTGKYGGPRPQVLRKQTSASGEPTQEIESRKEKGDMMSQENESQVSEDTAPDEGETYAYEKLVHPVSGEVDILAILKFIAAKAEKAVLDTGDYRQEGAFVMGRIRLTALIHEHKELKKSASALIAIMQHMGLVRNLTGTRSSSSWMIASSDYVSALTIQEAYLYGRRKYQQDCTVSGRIRRLSRKLEQLETSQAEPTATTSDPDLEEVALQAMAAAETHAEEREKLSVQLGEAQSKIQELESQLQDRRTSSAEFLKQRLEELKKKQS